MPPVPTSQLPACSLCGEPVEWAVPDSETQAEDQHTSSTDTADRASDNTSNDTANTQQEAAISVRTPATQPPAVVPNPVCRDCSQSATATDGEPIAGEPTAPAPTDELTPYTAGPNPVIIDGVKCWRTGTASRWQLCRDARDSPSCQAFLRQHTDSDGEPIQWFAPDPTGRPVQIRIAPTSAAELQRFCEQFDASTAFQVEPTEQANVPTEAEAPVVDLRHACDDHRANNVDSHHANNAGSHTFEALTLTAAPRRVQFSVAAIDTVRVVEPTAPPPAADADPNAVGRYRALAETAPSCIDPARLEAVIRQGEPRASFEAVRAINTVVDTEPAAGLDVIDLLSDQLQAEELTRLYAARALANIATTYPAAVAEEVSDLGELLTTESALMETETTRLVLYLAESDPATALDATPALASLLSPTPTRARRQALATVGLVADPYPEAIRPLVPQLCSLLETEDAQYRISSTAALGRVTAAYPDAATPAVPTLLEQLDAADSELRGNAVGVLGDIAREFPMDIAPYTDEISPLLEDDNPAVRSNTAGTLARIAADDPARIRPSVPELLDLLEDSWTRSRVHSCWALGYCGGREAADVLSRLRHTDPSEAVRNRAAWALEQIE